MRSRARGSLLSDAYNEGNGWGKANRSPQGAIILLFFRAATSLGSQPYHFETLSKTTIGATSAGPAI
jgi:hypothetical protein